MAPPWRPAPVAQPRRDWAACLRLLPTAPGVRAPKDWRAPFRTPAARHQRRRPHWPVGPGTDRPAVPDACAARSGPRSPKPTPPACPPTCQTVRSTRSRAAAGLPPWPGLLDAPNQRRTASPSPRPPRPRWGQPPEPANTRRWQPPAGPAQFPAAAPCAEELRPAHPRCTSPPDGQAPRPTRGYPPPHPGLAPAHAQAAGLPVRPRKPRAA